MTSESATDLNSLLAQHDRDRAEIARLDAALMEARAELDKLRYDLNWRTDDERRAVAERDAARAEVARLNKYIVTHDEEYQTIKDVLRAEHQACQRMRPVVEAAKEWRLAPHRYDANCNAGDCDECPARTAQEALMRAIDAYLAGSPPAMSDEISRMRPLVDAAVAYVSHVKTSDEVHLADGWLHRSLDLSKALEVETDAYLAGSSCAQARADSLSRAEELKLDERNGLEFARGLIRCMRFQVGASEKLQRDALAALDRLLKGRTL